MFNLIIVALDGSEHRLKALDYAREPVEKHDSKLSEHSDARFSHGICPDCIKKQYPKDEKH